MSLKLYNSLNRAKEEFKPINAPFVGMYVCGPTVYSDVHLGNCRTFVSFDLLYRYLLSKDYKVRYVRNITDVGHLEGDADSAADDKISKKARLEQLEPMEIVHKYTVGFQDVMRMLNTKTPNIEPTATGHIVEQIEMVKTILSNGLAYEREGSVYFNIPELLRRYPEQYGKLSGKVLDDLFTETRALKNQSEKENAADFAIWIKADERHLLRWPSPWSVGFPGWHLECSAMSTKYLGSEFDIHGGGMDLQFPHHENEIAQNLGACGHTPARYWMHGNMLLLNGKKMSKTVDPETGVSNSILPLELFTGENKLFSKAYSPMTLRFFMLQAHYRSTLDLTDGAMEASEKGYKRLMDGWAWLEKADYAALAKPNGLNAEEDTYAKQQLAQAYEDLDDDLNTAMALSRLFNLLNKINQFRNQQLPLGVWSAETFEAVKKAFKQLLFDIFGLRNEQESLASGNTLGQVMDLVLELRKNAREQKNWSASDLIRDQLNKAGIKVKDGAEGSTWEVE